jgi:hypothetical protein
MSNEPKFKDLSKLDYLPAFNDKIVSQIDNISLLAAAVVGLFGILYFSLAPAAMSTDVVIRSSQLSDGYNCKMIASITRKEKVFSDLTQKGIVPIGDSETKKSDANAQLAALANSSEFYRMFLPNGQAAFLQWSFQIQDGSTVADRDALAFDNSQFDTYEDCLAAARAQTTCSMPKDALYQFYAFSVPQQHICKTSIQCSSLNEKVYYTSFEVWLNRTQLESPAFGKCNNQANVSTCSNINSNCEIIKRFRSRYEDILRKSLLTPELICRPFLVNPPYICTKAVPPSVPSILAQSVAFMTTALAVVNTMLFYAVRMHNRYKKYNGVEPEVSGSELEHPTTVVETGTPTTDGTAPVAPASTKAEP